MAANFDTLSTARNLQEAGMDAAQAEAVAIAIKSVQGELVTKADIQNLEKRLEDKINNLRWTMIVVAGVVVALIKIIP